VENAELLEFHGERDNRWGKEEDDHHHEIQRMRDSLKTAYDDVESRTWEASSNALFFRCCPFSLRWRDINHCGRDLF